MEKCRLYGIKILFLLILVGFLLPGTWQLLAESGAHASELPPGAAETGFWEGLSLPAKLLFSLPALLVMAHICLSWTDAWRPKQIPQRKRHR